MTLRIGQYVLSGELHNTRRNRVFGWIEFAPDYGMQVELTGNFGESWAGKRIRFHAKTPPPTSKLEPGELPEVVEGLADRQIGVVGMFGPCEPGAPEIRLPGLIVPGTARLETDAKSGEQLRADSVSPALPSPPPTDSSERGSEAGDQAAANISFRLEWFSQNGHVVADLTQHDLQVVVDDVATDGNAKRDDGKVQDAGDEEGLMEPSAFGLPIDELEDALEEDEDDSPEDPYGLFDSRLEANLAQALGHDADDSLADFNAEQDGSTASSKPAWDEIIPGLDPDIQAMYEKWDEIFEGRLDEPVSFLLPEPMHLPKPDSVDSEDQAEQLVRTILAQMARLSIAVDVCEHFTALQTYRMLVQDILPTAKVHPGLAETDMVQHYTTSDYCSVCDAEFEAEFGPSDDARNDTTEQDDSDEDEDTD